MQVRLLPAHCVRAYVGRNKIDATDVAAMLEAARASDMRPVRVESVEQPALQGLTAFFAVDEQAHLMHQRLAGLLPGVRYFRCRVFGCSRLAIAIVAETLGDVTHFTDARHFANWFGLKPNEYSSESSRYLGHISKKGDRYLRMLLTHGARRVLRAEQATQSAGKQVQGATGARTQQP